MSPRQSSPGSKLLDALGVLAGLVGGIAVGLRAASRPEEQRPPAGQMMPADSWASEAPQTREAIETAPAPAEQQPRPRPQVRPGWTAVPAEPLPRTTYWPAVMSLGVVFILWGIATTYLISIVGLILLILALGGWIGELRHEH